MTLLEKARLNRRIAVNIVKAKPRRDRMRPQDIRSKLVVICGDMRVRPGDFDPNLGLRLAA